MRRGFTLLETLIAVSIGLVVLGLVLGLSSALWRAYHRSDERHSPREEAHLAFLSIRQYLPDAVFYQITDGATRLVFRSPSAEGVLKLDAARGRLLFRAPGQKTEHVLIGTRVESFRAEVRRRGVVRLTLVLERPPAPGAMQALAPLTMVDEVLLPCLALRHPKNPWHCPVEKAPGEPRAP